MNVLNKKSLSLDEVEAYLKKEELDNKKPIHEYLKKFSKTDKEKAKKIADAMNALNNPKIKEENIVKTIDLLPEDAEDVNKIFNDVSLTEEEANAILEIVKR